MATQGIFMFNDRLYKQIDGVTMGSPLGPTLANFFLGQLEEKIFAQNSSTEPKLYLRYVDDVYAIFDDYDSCSSFLSTLNSQHKDIKFTVEKATKTLSFLDVEINITDNGFESWVWRKKTNTGVILNYNAICPKSWKTGLIMCLLKRAKTICSNNMLYNKEVRKLRSIFLKNSYPNWFFENALLKFDDREKKTKDKEEKEYLFRIGVPYFGKPSHKFAKRLSTLVKVKFQVDLAVYYNSFKTSSYFNLKCLTPHALLSNVVYKFTCSRDAAMSYIGMTTRHLGIRAHEHLSLQLNSKKTAVKNHILACERCKSGSLTVNDFKVVQKCSNEYETKIQEALIIKKQNPRLNSQLYANGSSFLLNVF